MAAEVFATTELLENVLLRLPVRKILLVQCVCSKWRNVIRGSPALQRTLYKPCDPENVLRPRASITSSHLKYPGQISSGAFLHTIFKVDNTGRGFLVLRRRNDPKSSTWRDMFATCPPVSLLIGEIWGRKANKNPFSDEVVDELLQKVWIRDNQGIRLGQLAANAERGEYLRIADLPNWKTAGEEESAGTAAK